MKINVNLYTIFFSIYIFQHYLNRILNSEFSKGIPLIGQNTIIPILTILGFQHF